MTRTFKVLSVLLSYPAADFSAAAHELTELLCAERLLTPRQIERLSPLIEELATGDLFDNQERYVLLFDRTRSLSLHLFEHVHGESRDRGQAMVDLIAVYERAGLQVTAGELPDFLPLFLEFLSTRPVAEALELLSQPAHILAAIAERLGKRKSSYAAVFGILADLAKADPKAIEVRALIALPDVDPTDLAALDAAWVDEEVRFGPTAEAQCGGDTLISKLRAANRPAPGIEPMARATPRTIVTHSPARNR